MACSLPQLDDVLKASPEKTNFIRLSRLLVCAGTKVMRKLLDYIVPDLPKTLADPIVKARLNKMKTKNILNTMQWDKLFPAPGSFGKADDFDITLLFKLLREVLISNLTPPPSGWDILPNSTDYTIEADLARLKHYRNEMAHGQMEVDDVDFNTYWDQIKGSLLRIVKFLPDDVLNYKTCEKQICKFRTSPLTDDGQKYTDALLEWVQGIEINVNTVVKLAATGAWVAGSALILNRYKDDPKILISLVEKAIVPAFGGIVIAIMRGSIKIVLQIEEVEALEELWERYKTGQLQKDLEKVLVTEELRQLAEGDDVELTVSINAEEYQSARHYLIGSRAAEGPGWEPGKEEGLLEKLEKYFEGIKLKAHGMLFQATQKKERPTRPDHPPEIIHGETIIKDRKSTFQAHLAYINYKDQIEQVLAELKKDRKIEKATYNIHAYRIFDEERSSYIEDSDDDGENKAGGKLLHLLKVSNVENVVVIVTRWHGGIHLGADRFKHINKCATDLLHSQGLTGAQASTEQKETKGKSKSKKSK